MVKQLLFFIFIAIQAGLSAQISQNFDGGTFPPAGWQEYHTGVDALYDTNIRAYSNPNSTLFDDEFGTDTSWLVFPQISNLGANYELTFWQNQNYDTYYEYHGIWISTSNSNPASGSFVELDSLGAGTEDTWEKITVDLSAYSGQSIYLAFKYIGDFADEWHIDNVKVDTVGSQPCSVPTSFASSSVGTDSVSLSWTPFGGELYWIIEYGSTGFTLGTGSTIYANTPSKTINGLSPNTTYDFYIQAVCSITDSSGYSSVLTETTNCLSGLSMSIPYSENFDGLSIPNIPCGYTVKDLNTDAIKWITDTTNANSGANHLLMTYSSPGVPQNDWIYTPYFHVTDTSKVYEFGFSYASRSGAAFPEKMEAVITTQTNATSIEQTLFRDTAILTSNFYVDTSFEIKFLDTGNHYFAFHLFSDPDQWDFMIDDIWFQEKAFIGVAEIKKPDLTIFPNPSSTIVNIISENRISNIKLFNIDGQEVLNQNINSNKHQINIEKLASTTYFLQATINGNIIVKKMTKL